ncbi:MAG: MFS transporter [bacterium]|nr:MFS transporter [bacterium]
MPSVSTGKSRREPLPRNVWAASITSFLTDVSSEMVLNLLPLFLANVLGLKASVIGVIEGVAASTASLLKLATGWVSDRLSQRKWLAVAGYGISTLVKPFYWFAGTWEAVAGVRWAERIGKGIRTAPRDALIADSISEEQRGRAFGLHRAADTGGAVVGLGVAMLAVWAVQRGGTYLVEDTFRAIVLLSLLPAALAVLVLAVGVRERPRVVQPSDGDRRPGIRDLGSRFLIFMGIVAVFDIGNSSDAFLILRASERGISVLGILAMLLSFNLVYTVTSLPAGSLSDRIGRRRVIIAGWLLYAVVYAGLAVAEAGWHIWSLYLAYGLYYGLSYGTLKAFIADLVDPRLRGTAYGLHAAVIGVLDLPASVIAGVLWSGVGSWPGHGPAAPFWFGAITACAAALLLGLLMRETQT